MIITNNTGISLPLAVWLIHDEYDYDGRERAISATSLMKPTRMLVLQSRLKPEDFKSDVSEYVPRAMGHSIHDSMEKAWRAYQINLRRLGYPQDVIDAVRVNPSDDELRSNPNIIPVFLEQRGERKIDGWIVRGKFDQVMEGILNDTKSTSTYSADSESKREDFKIQMSIYRWIDAARPIPYVTEDFGVINFVFTDWMKARAKGDPSYPQSRVQTIRIPLMSLDETENWIRGRLNALSRNQGVSEDRLPHCTPEELWMSEPTFKYYSDPTKTAGKSTKNFDTLVAANAFRNEKGKGVVVTKLGEPKRCEYCPAFETCSQKDAYFP